MHMHMHECMYMYIYIYICTDAGNRVVTWQKADKEHVLEARCTVHNLSAEGKMCVFACVCAYIYIYIYI
jgi:hypothetical protein